MAEISGSLAKPRYFFETNKASSTSIVTVLERSLIFFRKISSNVNVYVPALHWVQKWIDRKQKDFIIHKTYLFIYKTKRWLKLPAYCFTVYGSLDSLSALHLFLLQTTAL